MTNTIRIARIQTFRLRAEVDALPSSTLGSMRARNGLLVRIEDADGAGIGIVPEPGALRRFDVN